MRHVAFALACGLSIWMLMAAPYVARGDGNDGVIEKGSGTYVAGPGNIVCDDSDAANDTYFDCGTDDVMKIYVDAAQDFTFAANTFTAEAGSSIYSDNIGSTGGTAIAFKPDRATTAFTMTADSFTATSGSSIYADRYGSEDSTTWIATADNVAADITVTSGNVACSGAVTVPVTTGKICADAACNSYWYSGGNNMYLSIAGSLRWASSPGAAGPASSLDSITNTGHFRSTGTTTNLGGDCTTSHSLPNSTGVCAVGDVEIEGGDIYLDGAKGQTSHYSHKTEDVTFSADPGDATQVTTGSIISAGAIVTGVSGRVTTANTGGCTSMDIGIAAKDTDAFGDGIAVAATTTFTHADGEASADWSAAGLGILPSMSAQEITVTAVGGDGACDDMVVSLTVSYIDTTAATAN